MCRGPAEKSAGLSSFSVFLPSFTFPFTASGSEHHNADGDSGRGGSVASSDFQKDPNSTLESVSAMLQYRALRFMEVCTQHNTGKLTDEEYALWRATLSPCWNLRCRSGAGNEKSITGVSPKAAELPYPNPVNKPFVGAGYAFASRTLTGKVFTNRIPSISAHTMFRA